MNANDILKYGHAMVQSTVEGLSEADWNAPNMVGTWSIRDIIAHLGSYEHMLEELLVGFTGGDAPHPYLDTMAQRGSGGFNDAIVEASKGQSQEEVLADYNDTAARVAALIAQIPAETLRQVGTIPWYGAEYALDDYLVYAIYGHKREHCAQIALVRDRLKEQQG